MEKTSFAQVVFYLEDGKTLLFHHVTKWHTSAVHIEFYYEGQSTGHKSHMQMEKDWVRAIAKSVDD